MRPFSDPEQIEALLSDVDLVSTDVFDTLLLRRLRSERARIQHGERLFAQALLQAGHQVLASELTSARLEAQRLAYRAHDLSSRSGEVALDGIVERQLSMLGLPHTFLPQRLAIEVEVERASLRPNLALAASLRACKAMGRRVVAISDTALSAAAIEMLIERHHGAGLLDATYSSAQCGSTKREGGLFRLVLAEQGVAPGRMLHLGDDDHADHRVPGILGIRTIHLPRPGWRRKASRAHGAVVELQRTLRSDTPRRGASSVSIADPFAFGRDVLGPIVAEFCLAIWLFAAEAERHDDAALLFCARGGIGIRECFERVLARLGVTLSMPRRNLAVSRLVAARAALLVGAPAALDELGREFAGRSFADVASALGGRRYDLPQSWRNGFRQDAFLAMLHGHEGAELKRDIERQTALFRQHLDSVREGRNRIVLCDTGLYGSTHRLLAAAWPDLSFTTIQLARSNYKRLDQDHFSRVVGLLIERDRYAPFVLRSALLRYWQLAESLFEPRLPSVRTFSQTSEGAVVSNAGEIEYGATRFSEGNPLLSGALAYLDRFEPGAAQREIGPAWRRLRRAILSPDHADLEALAIGERSVDFGRDETVADRRGKSTPSVARILSIRSQFWREGAIMREFPRSGRSLLALLELAQMLRGLNPRRLR